MDIKTASFVTSLSQYQEKPPIILPQLAVVGKSNVGKSSLINSLCNRKKRRIILIAGSVLSALALTLVIAFLPQLATGELKK